MSGSIPNSCPCLLPGWGTSFTFHHRLDNASCCSTQHPISASVSHSLLFRSICHSFYLSSNLLVPSPIRGGKRKKKLNIFPNLSQIFGSNCFKFEDWGRGVLQQLSLAKAYRRVQNDSCLPESFSTRIN